MISLAKIIQASQGQDRLVSDSHCQSILHTERRAYDEIVERGDSAGFDSDTAADRYREIMQAHRSSVESSTRLSPARRASILKRLDQAIADGVPRGADGQPDCGLVYAFSQVVSRTQERNDHLNRTLFHYSRRTGVPLGEVVTSFRGNLENAPRRGDARGDFPADIEASADNVLA
ncbi:MAG: hypothetical protein ABGW95_02130, partial [Candidatus Poseidoniia archaeon]